MELISRWIADFIGFIGKQAQIFWLNLELLNFSWQQIFIDIVLVAIIFYFIFSLLKGSRAINVIVGLAILTLIYLISRTFHLVTLNWLMAQFFTVALIAIPVIFQKELRMGLEKLGHTNWHVKLREKEIDKMINNVVSACEEMAGQKTGALIVIQGQIPLKEFVDTGVEINADVSRELILSIFNTKSPLHDGAIIIANERIEAAACILPHSLEEKSSDMGTRHKAGLGITDSTDSVAIVVSEEKGTMAFSYAGKMQKNLSGDKLKALLNQILKPKQKKNHETVKQYKS